MRRAFRRIFDFYWGRGIADDVPALTYYLLLSLAPLALGLAAVQALLLKNLLSAIEVADPETGIPQFRMNFTDVVLGGFKADPDVSIGEAGPIEEFRLNFANVEFNYNPIAEESVGDILQSIFKNLGLAPAQ